MSDYLYAQHLVIQHTVFLLIKFVFALVFLHRYRSRHIPCLYRIADDSILNKILLLYNNFILIKNNTNVKKIKTE